MQPASNPSEESQRNRGFLFARARRGQAEDGLKFQQRWLQDRVRNISLLTVLLAFVLAAGCHRHSAPLRVGANVWPGYEPLFLAKSLGFYGDEPIQLLSFLSSTEVLRAYRNRAIDVAAVTADEALLLAESMPDQRIILVCDVSHGADVILAKPGFSTFTDLRGRRIGVESGALGAYVLARALEVNRMDATEVTVETVPLNEHEEAFRSGRVDALVTFEPVRSRLIAEGGHQVFNSSQIPGEIVDVLITRAELVEEEAHLLHALVRGWFRALSRMKSHPEECARAMAIREQTTPEAFLASLQLLRLPDRASNRELLEGSQTNLLGALQRLARSMAQHRLISKPPDTSNLLESRFIPPADL